MWYIKPDMSNMFQYNVESIIGALIHRKILILLTKHNIMLSVISYRTHIRM